MSGCRIAALLIAVLASGLHNAVAAANPTRIQQFRPAVPKGPVRKGNCWTDSIAVSRPGAWRCVAGNEINDPCFSNPQLRRAVICGANPADGAAGFVLNLTKPLPKPSGRAPAHPRPWLLKLTDGSTCEIQTGTTPFVAGLAIPYGCSDSKPCGDNGCPYMTGLTEDFKRGPVWTAHKVAFSSSDEGLKLLSRRSVAVTDIWK